MIFYAVQDKLSGKFLNKVGYATLSRIPRLYGSVKNAIASAKLNLGAFEYGYTIIKLVVEVDDE